jgi:hypothetical protein
MIKLTKKADAFWAGNGFGNEAAEWVVKGAEDIVVRKSGSGWIATENGTRIVSGRGTKKEVIAELEWKRPELAAKSDPAKRIADMDLSNLTVEQIEVIRRLALRAEADSFERSNRADNDDARNGWGNLAESIGRLLGRLDNEKENREEAA